MTRAELAAVAKWFKDAAAGTFRDPRNNKVLSALSLDREPSALTRQLVFWLYDVRHSERLYSYRAKQRKSLSEDDILYLQWLCGLLADLANRERGPIPTESITLADGNGVPVEQSRPRSTFRLVLEIVYAARSLEATLGTYNASEAFMKRSKSGRRSPDRVREEARRDAKLQDDANRLYERAVDAGMNRKWSGPAGIAAQVGMRASPPLKERQVRDRITNPAKLRRRP